MGYGEVVDFTKPKEAQPTNELQRLSGAAPQGVQVVKHEEVIIEGEGRIRRPMKKEGEPEVRLRVTDKPAWERVKRDEDE